MKVLETDLNRPGDPTVPRRRGRKLTLFDVFESTSVLFGITTGILLGWKHSGVIGGSIGAVIGCSAGFLLGRLPLFIGLQVLGMRRKNTEELEAIFQKDQYYIFHLALQELMSRGIEVSPQKPIILGLLLSDASERRSFGWSCVQLAFPELARALSGFSPERPSEDHLEKIRRFKQDQGWAGADQKKPTRP